MDKDFLAAREAYRVGNAARLDAYAKRLRGHLLEPYVLYYQLKMRLVDASFEDAHAFIASYHDSPLSERLRANWLKVLGKSERWDLFEQELPQLRDADLELTCYALQFRARADPDEALEEARPLWFVTRRLPGSCAPLMKALMASGMLSSDDIWTRIRYALEAGRVNLARRLAQQLPRGEAPASRVLEAARSNPARYLERQRFNLKYRGGRETVMFAAHRLARTSPSQAARHWASLEDRFSPEERAYVWSLIGYLGARAHDPGALEWYARAGENLSDLQLAWKVRAALRARAWPEVLAAIEAMTEEESEKPAWRFWRARALMETGRAREAEEILKPLATEFNFYGQLAVEELGGRIEAPLIAYRPTDAEVDAMNELIGIRRALELDRLGKRIDANLEWRWAIRGFDDKQLLAAAEIARRYEDYDRTISTANRTISLHDFSLRYPAPYREVLQSHAEEFALDEAWIYGLIRQESRFIVNARSQAGARGLMQLMPSTARWVARKLQLKNWRWSRMTDVDTNINLGTYYLRHVLDALDGHAVLASAGYNAGPHRARAWRPETAIEGAVYAETIPFNETRNYVKRVMANTTYYAHNFGRNLQSLKQRLGIIQARDVNGEKPLGDTP
ncbi:MAG: lytic transglycosylase domain-containing protein [Betaproteobacteria bacterium]|nr:lytic transglycosylase domain-containing protein [Betaproteobacteria bacterium]